MTKKINRATCRTTIGAAPSHVEHAKIDYNLNAVSMHRLEPLISEHADINLKAISASPLKDRHRATWKTQKQIDNDAIIIFSAR